MVRRGIKILFIVLFLFLLYSSGYLTFEKYRTGDIIGRQNLVSDTIWKLQRYVLLFWNKKSASIEQGGYSGAITNDPVSSAFPPKELGIFFKFRYV